MAVLHFQGWWQEGKGKTSYLLPPMSSALHKSARLPKGVTQKLLGRNTKPLETDRMLQKPKSILKQKGQDTRGFLPMLYQKYKVVAESIRNFF